MGAPVMVCGSGSGSNSSSTHGNSLQLQPVVGAAIGVSSHEGRAGRADSVQRAASRDSTVATVTRYNNDEMADSAARACTARTAWPKSVKKEKGAVLP